MTKAWLPIESQVISREIAKQLGEPNLKGSYITQVYPGSTAAKAGLKAGDFVVAVDGEKLTSASPEHEDELVTMMRQFEVGKTVELSVLRNKIPLKIPVELARSPKLKREMKKFRSDRFEFTARDVSFFDVADEQWDPTQRGALVEEVKSGSWAELGALLVGDLIVELDGQAVTDVDTLKRVTEQIAARKAVNVKLKVQRGIHTVYLELEPSWKD